MRSQPPVGRSPSLAPHNRGSGGQDHRTYPGTTQIIRIRTHPVHWWINTGFTFKAQAICRFKQDGWFQGNLKLDGVPLGKICPSRNRHTLIELVDPSHSQNDPRPDLTNIIPNTVQMRSRYRDHLIASVNPHGKYLITNNSILYR